MSRKRGLRTQKITKPNPIMARVMALADKRHILVRQTTIRGHPSWGGILAFAPDGFKEILLDATETRWPLEATCAHELVHAVRHTALGFDGKLYREHGPYYSRMEQQAERGARLLLRLVRRGLEP